MNTAQPLEMVQYRLAQHYIGKLRQANMLLERNRQNSVHWYQVIEQDWPQIRNWQQWAASDNTENSQRAKLCAAFATDGHEYLSIRLSTAERLVWYRQALKAAQQTGDDKKERHLLYDVGTTAYQTGIYEEAETCAKHLLELGRKLKDHMSLGYGWFITGNLHTHRTELDAAETAFRKAARHFETSHADMMIGHAIQGIARILIFRGRYKEALIHASRYLEIIKAAGRESDFSLAYHTLSNIHTRLGNLIEAKGYALKAVEISRRHGYVRMIHANLLILGYAELALNELDSAWEHFQETIAASRTNSAKFDLTAATYSLGDVRLRQQNYPEALTYYQQALALADESRIAAYRSLCAIEIAYIHVLQNNLGAARISLQNGAEVALQIKSDILLAKALIPAMKLWQATDDPEQAAEWAGLLIQHPEHAEPKRVETISHEIEAQIGTERYSIAVERGKTLPLNTAVVNLIDMLNRSQQPITTA